MKSTALILCLALSLPLSAERRRTAAPPAGALSIEFVDGRVDGATFVASGSDAWVELDTVSQRAGSMGKPLRIQRPFGIRILRAGGVSWGTAKVTARLESPDGRSSLRIDGQIVGSAPLVVSTHAVIGTTTTHMLEIEVPGSVAAGPLAASIAWDVTTE
jgi:hypothetical protein